MALLASVDMTNAGTYAAFRNVSASAVFSHQAGRAFNGGNAARFLLPSAGGDTYCGISGLSWTPSAHVCVGYCMFFGPTFIQSIDGSSSDKPLILMRNNLANIVRATFTVGANTNITSYTGETGGAWTAPGGGTFTVDQAGGFVRLTSGGQEFAYNAQVPPSANYFVEVTGRTVNTATADRFGPVVRGNGLAFGVAGANAYYAYVRGDGVLQLFRMLNGTPVQLGSDYTIAGFSASTDYRVRLQANGTSLRVYLNDNEVIAVTDSNIAVAGQIGIYERQGNARITDLTTEDVTHNPRIIQNWRSGDGSAFPLASYFGSVDSNVDHNVAQLVPEFSVGPFALADYVGQYLYWITGVNNSANRRYMKVWNRYGLIAHQEGTLSRTDGLYYGNDTSGYFDEQRVDNDSWYEVSHYAAHDTEILAPPDGFLLTGGSSNSNLNAVVAAHRRRHRLSHF